MALSSALQIFQGGSPQASVGKFLQALRTAPHFVHMIPREKICESSAGVPPDYATMESWLAHPDRVRGTRDVEDANHLAPETATVTPIEGRVCDCFFVVDSCYTPDIAQAFTPEKTARRWNVPLGCPGDDKSSQRLNSKVIEQMLLRTAAAASCFNRTCRVYAPAYRQANVLAYMLLSGLKGLSEKKKSEGTPCLSLSALLRSQDAVRAFDLAYKDVQRAFVEFVDDPRNADRPFIVVGHSQGSNHLTRLLQEEVENHPSRLRRFVHGYLTGAAVPMEIFSRALRMV
jgi:hypothetical protein